MLKKLLLATMVAVPSVVSGPTTQAQQPSGDVDLLRPAILAVVEHVRREDTQSRGNVIVLDPRKVSPRAGVSRAVGRLGDTEVEHLKMSLGIARVEELESLYACRAPGGCTLEGADMVLQVSELDRDDETATVVVRAVYKTEHPMESASVVRRSTSDVAYRVTLIRRGSSWHVDQIRGLWVS